MPATKMNNCAYTFVDDISNLNYLSMTMNACILDCFVALLLAMTRNATNTTKTLPEERVFVN